jgi:hypothetical protein
MVSTGWDILQGYRYTFCEKYLHMTSFLMAVMFHALNGRLIYPPVIALEGAVSELNCSCLRLDITEEPNHKMMGEIAAMPVKITNQVMNNL